METIGDFVVIEAKDRTKAGKTAPACGLTLMEIEI